MTYKYCAGVLPYCSLGGKTLFLLGRSRKLNMWTTFSGKDDVDDTNVYETAAREFDEESLGVVLPRERVLFLVQKTPVVLHSKTPRGRPCRIFVIQVPYSKLYGTTFAHTSHFIKRFDRQLVYKYTEIKEVRWIDEAVMFNHIKALWMRTHHLDEIEWTKLSRLTPQFLLS